MGSISEYFPWRRKGEAKAKAKLIEQKGRMINSIPAGDCAQWASSGAIVSMAASIMLFKYLVGTGLASPWMTGTAHWSKIHQFSKLSKLVDDFDNLRVFFKNIRDQQRLFNLNCQANKIIHIWIESLIFYHVIEKT